MECKRSTRPQTHSEYYEGGVRFSPSYFGTTSSNCYLFERTVVTCKHISFEGGRPLDKERPLELRSSSNMVLMADDGMWLERKRRIYTEAVYVFRLILIACHEIVICFKYNTFSSFCPLHPKLGGFVRGGGERKGYPPKFLTIHPKK